MSFLFKGDEGPTNIPEGRGLFQAIAQAGLQSAQENNFGGRRRRVKSRMAGQKGGRRPRPFDDNIITPYGDPRDPNYAEQKKAIFEKYGEPRNPRGYLPFHRMNKEGKIVDGDNERREVTTPGFPSDERPGIRPPRDRRPGIRPPRDNKRRSNDDINVGFGLIQNPRRKRRRRSAQEKQEIRKRGSQRFRGEKINEQSN
tara:strand:+ start:201 stop:797 length:597 start_codon:yes stop_codon:yes gene_type:complete